MKNNISIFDIDGTVADDRWRRHLIDWQDPDPMRRYERYHLAAPADLPINQHIVESRRKLGDEVVFMTSRPIEYYGPTRAWLQRYFPGLTIQLSMRGLTDTRPSPALKLDIVRALTECYVGHLIYDDRADVIQELYDAGYTGVVRVLTCEEPISIPTPPKAMGETEKPALHQPRADEILLAGAKTYAQRNAAYGNNYHSFGAVMAAMFPDGAHIETPDEWNRWGVFIQMMGKLTRFSNSELEHIDSVHDLMVYSAMMEELLRD